MLQYRRFVCNPIQENTYVVWDGKTRDAAVIDCGAFSEPEKQEIAGFISGQQLKPTLALQTHMHFDHIFGLGWLKDKYGLRPICHTMEQENYDMQERMAAEMFGTAVPIAMPGILHYVKDGDVIALGESSLSVIYTPGHTAGGVSYYGDGLLFSGDTLFAGSCGRTDLPGGNMQEEIHSIRERLLTLPPETRLLSGHGYESTVGDEKRHWM